MDEVVFVTMKKKVLQVGAKRVEKTPVPKKTYKSKTPPTPKKPPTRKYKRKDITEVNILKKSRQNKAPATPKSSKLGPLMLNSEGRGTWPPLYPQPKNTFNMGMMASSFISPPPLRCTCPSHLFMQQNGMHQTPPLTLHQNYIHPLPDSEFYKPGYLNTPRRPCVLPCCVKKTLPKVFEEDADYTKELDKYLGNSPHTEQQTSSDLWKEGELEDLLEEYDLGDLSSLNLETPAFKDMFKPVPCNCSRNREVDTILGHLLV